MKKIILDILNEFAGKVDNHEEVITESAFDGLADKIVGQIEPQVSLGVPQPMQIAVGDYVNVYFERITALSNYRVEYIPTATSDSWHLSKDGKIVYVQLFNLMEKASNLSN